MTKTWTFVYRSGQTKTVVASSQERAMKKLGLHKDAVRFGWVGVRVR